MNSDTGSVADDTELPLAGVRVLDLSTLLPGPLATLMFAEAGADVVKLERPGVGDELRTYQPRFGSSSVNFAVLNRGKRSYAADFKDPEQRDYILGLAAAADVVVEQFRPGVVDRLGLGYEQISAVNPKVVYCSISGYGPTSPYAGRAGHDLNYLAESGLLGTVVDGAGSPTLPVSLLGDIAGGTYPAVVNILLALRRAERTGKGCHVNVSMTHNLQTLAYMHISNHQMSGEWPKPSAELLTGGSPRYNIYATSDGRHIACAALEQRFWERLVEVVGLDSSFHDDNGREQAVTEALASVFGAKPAAYWRDLLRDEDVCTVVVSTWEEAQQAGLVETSLCDRVSDPASPDRSIPTIHSPIDPELRRSGETVPYPSLAELPETSPWPGIVERQLTLS